MTGSGSIEGPPRYGAGPLMGSGRGVKGFVSLEFTSLAPVTTVTGALHLGALGWTQHGFMFTGHAASA
jgi:hypothetical protein